MDRSPRRLAAHLATAALIAGLVTACASASAPGSSDPAPAVTDSATLGPPKFQPTWIPSYLPHTTHPLAQYVRWNGPGNTSGQAPVAEGFVFESTQGTRRQISVTVVAASAYPAGYWTSFKESSSWQHKQLGQLQAAIKYGVGGSNTTVISSNRGYLVQIFCSGITAADVDHFTGAIRWDG